MEGGTLAERALEKSEEDVGGQSALVGLVQVDDL